ncbi:MAG: hypothetical protein KQJ78_12855 [Deltaproteobacteria bacterium]|nr:hypothetical protein [Deltaproteobacteria bacterium]
MAVTFQNMARIASQTSLAVGQSQAQGLGLGQDSAGALAVTNMLDQENKPKNLVEELMPSRERLKGQGFTNDLKKIGQAALALGPGRGQGSSASSGLLGSNIISNKA